MPQIDGKNPTKVSFDMDEKLLAELRRVAQENDRTVAAEIRRALKAYLRVAETA